MVTRPPPEVPSLPQLTRRQTFWLVVLIGGTCIATLLVLLFAQPPP